MNQFVTVQYLIQSLNRQEIKSLKRFLKLFEDGSGTDGLKTLKLANILLKDYECKKTENDMIRMLYKKVNLKNQKTFNKLIARFKEKVIECISLDVNTQRRVQYSQAEIAISGIKKSMLHFHLLQDRLPEQELHRMIDKCISICRQYEFYSGLSTALIYKLDLLGRIQNTAESERIYSEFEFCSRCLQSLTKARQLRFELNQLNQKNSAKSEELYLKAIDETEHEFRFTRSQQLFFLHQHIKVMYWQYKGDYSKAHLYVGKLHEHCTEHIETLPQTFFTESQLLLAESLIHLGKLKEAIEILVRINTHNNHLARLKRAELLLISSIYSGNLSDAYTNLGELRSLASYTQHYTPFVSFDYLKSTLLCLEGKNNEAFLALQSPSESMSNDPEQEIINRLMITISLLGANKLDLAASQLDNLNNYINRQGMSQVISIRYYRIIRIFDELAEKGFDFANFSVSHMDEINDLIFENDLPIWPLHKAEIVHFGVWLKSKVTAQTYQDILQSLLQKVSESVIVNQGLSL